MSGRELWSYFGKSESSIVCVCVCVCVCVFRERTVTLLRLSTTPFFNPFHFQLRLRVSDPDQPPRYPVLYSHRPLWRSRVNCSWWQYLQSDISQRAQIMLHRLMCARTRFESRSPNAYARTYHIPAARNSCAHSSNPLLAANAEGKNACRRLSSCSSVRFSPASQRPAATCSAE